MALGLNPLPLRVLPLGRGRVLGGPLLSKIAKMIIRAYAYFQNGVFDTENTALSVQNPLVTFKPLRPYGHLPFAGEELIGPLRGESYFILKQGRLSYFCWILALASV